MKTQGIITRKNNGSKLDTAVAIVTSCGIVAGMMLYYYLMLPGLPKW